MSIAEVIRNNKVLILKRWKERLFKEIPGVKRHENTAIEDSVPEWIEALLNVLDNDDNNQIVFLSQEHALDRSRFQIYSLKHIIREYNFLKREIFQLTDENDGCNPDDRDQIMNAIDQSIEEAAETFHRIKEGVHVDARAMAEQKADSMQLQDKNREQFIRSITHDLNNPLINLKGCISLLEEGPDVNETAKILKMLKTCTEKAEFLVRDFLDVKEVNSTEKLPIRKARVKIVEELEKEVAIYKQAYRNRIDFQCANSDLEAEVDVGLLRRTFNNLMNNAIKHGAKAPIEVRCSVENNMIAISVINQGRTIPPSEMEHIFNRYYKIEDGSRGWGIGLAFVKEVASAHGGEVSVKSEEGEGTMFTFRIPMR